MGIRNLRSSTKSDEIDASESPDPKADRIQATTIEKVDALVSQSIDIDPALDRRITRKFDKHIVPWLFGLWLLAFIDRSNIGNAKIDGLTTDLGLTGNKYNIVSILRDC